MPQKHNSKVKELTEENHQVFPQYLKISVEIYKIDKPFGQLTKKIEEPN